MDLPEIAFREATPGDATTLATIGAATLLEAFAGWLPGDALLAHCRHHHTPETWASLLDATGSRAWLAEAAPGGAPVGYALLVTRPEFPEELLLPGDVELRRIYLFSRFHGTGAAQALLRLAVSAARQACASRLLLGVHQDNLRARAFYRRSGFVEIGRRQFQVGALCMDDPVLALDLSIRGDS